MADRPVQVWVDRAAGPARVGTLFVHSGRRSESSTFEYAASWLSAREAFALDPTFLPLGAGPFQTPAGSPLFAALTDSAPDRWGRTLMQRASRRRDARTSLREIDYLLGVDDFARQGALRFRFEDDGPFLAHEASPIPPLVRLGELLSASDAVQRDEPDEAGLRLLLVPGSSLGGARPKASIVDVHGELSVAKFPALTDEWSVIPWEQTCMDLARAARLDVAATRLVAVADRPVLVSRRFDRERGGRIPYLSALAMLGAADGEQCSYLELADALRRFGQEVEAGLAEIWSRMVFNVLVSNTDDHLRNHGFLRRPEGWYPSPMFDLNPVPVDVRPRFHSLFLDDATDEASLQTVLDVADYFGLAATSARRRAAEVGSAVARWREVAGRNGISSAEQERMASAFEHEDLATALALV